MEFSINNERRIIICYVNFFSSDDEHWQSFSEYEDEYAEEPLEPEHVEVLWMDNLKLSMVPFSFILSCLD